MKKLLALALASLMMLSLAACGGSSSSGSSSSSASSAPAASAPAASAPAASAPAAEEKTDDTVYTLKFGHDSNEDSSYQAGALALKRIVEERSNGRLQIEVYNSGSLGSESELLESVRMGVVDMCFCTAANASTTFPEMGLFSVSFLFEDQAHFERCLQPGSDLTNELKSIVANSAQGCSLAACITQGLRSVESKTPIRHPDDLKGVTMRVMNSETEILVWSTIGALPSNIATGECYSALQTGVIAALENSPAILNSWKFYEVAPYVCLTEHEYLISGLWLSDNVQKKIPADLYEILLGCMDDAAKEEMEFDVLNDQMGIQALKDNGAEIVEDVDKQAFIDKVAPLRDQVAEQLGAQKLVELIEAEKA